MLPLFPLPRTAGAAVPLALASLVPGSVLHTLVDLVKVEQKLVLGTLLIIVFEYATSLRASVGDQRRRSAPVTGRWLGGEMRRQAAARGWMLVCFCVTIVWANLSGFTGILTAAGVGAGLALLTKSWLNIARDNPLAENVWRSVGKNLLERGVALALDVDEAGRRVARVEPLAPGEADTSEEDLAASVEAAQAAVQAFAPLPLVAPVVGVGLPPSSP